MTRLAKIFPWVVVGLFALWAAARMYPRPETHKEFDLTGFGALPILDGGRLKPLDSVARTTMLHISERSEFEDLDGKTRPAVLWLLEVLAGGGPNASPAADFKVFRVDNEQLLAELGLEYRPGSYRYSWNEVMKVGDRFDRLYAAARAKEDRKERGEKVPAEARDVFHGKVLQLGGRLVAYERLAGRKLTVVPKEKGGEVWLSLAEVDQQAGQPFEQEAKEWAFRVVRARAEAAGFRFEDLDGERLAAFQQLVKREVPNQLRRLGEQHRGSVSPAAAAFGDVLAAYKENKPKAFAEALAAYRADHLYPLTPSLRDTTAFEHGLNYASPFYYAAFLYIFAGVCSALSWLGWAEPPRRAGVGLAAAALVLTVAGLLGRMYVMDRPLVFVTNLYSSALLIGAGAVAACLYVERLFRNGVGLVVGTTIGATTVAIAHGLTFEGKDTLGTLVAVLDTNFWLASHVTTVTLGYAATYLAGFLGVVYILWGLFLPTLTREKHVAVGNMIYGVTCFATLLSFVGTVLGGIWADQSWGRFWGWDPKENGAVLIVIWNSLILHARWAGIVRQRGMAVLAVAGIMVTTWSWFGTNQLEVGLHNYGFNKELADWCKWTWIACTFLILLGCIPQRYWRSFTGTGQPRPEAAAPAPAAPVAAATAPKPEAAPVALPGTNGANGTPRKVKGKPGRRR